VTFVTFCSNRLLFFLLRDYAPLNQICGTTGPGRLVAFCSDRVAAALKNENRPQAGHRMRFNGAPGGLELQTPWNITLGDEPLARIDCKRLKRNPAQDCHAGQSTTPRAAVLLQLLQLLHLAPEFCSLSTYNNVFFYSL
jgi:hypothetical protein